MLNDGEEKYDNEESEYHFSDEEVSYDAETESPKATKETGQSGANLVQKLTQSKRMMISLVVFVAIVFVVYKMVSPAVPTDPSTDITTQVAATQPKASMTQPKSNLAAAQAQQVIPPQAAQQAVPQMQQPSIQSIQPPQTQDAMAQQQAQQQVVPPPQSSSAQNVIASQQMPSTQTYPSQQAQQMVANMQTPNTQMVPPTNQMPVSPQVPPQTSLTQPVVTQVQNQVTQSPTDTTQQMMQMQQQMLNNAMSQVATTVPVQSMPATQTVMMPNMNVPGSTTIDPKTAAMAVDSERLMAQLQAEYAQKVAAYQNENKNLQDQLQTLNSKMTTMEAQMNQMLQTLSRQTQQQESQSTSSADPVIQTQDAPPEPKIAFNVQAIIPGRAWLRGENGDTITVTEGDEVKGIGRVAKIDPYDGIVQINTGKRLVSLSYGNSG